MKLIESLTEVPRSAGEAEIEVVEGRSIQGMAMRDGRTIRLGDGGHSPRFYSIKEGQQFLFTVTDPSTRQTGRRVYFGGMDESPFLVELHPFAIEGLINGEDAFFAELKPDIIRGWEKKLEVPARRQGDFFAAGGPKLKWPELFRKSGLDTEFTVRQVENFQLRGTRHRFSGILATAGGSILGEGIITAPDHLPLELKSPHLIEQAVHLLQPQQAD